MDTNKSRVTLALLTNEIMMPFPSSLDLNKSRKGRLKLMGERKEQNIIGTRIGLYDVLYECDFKSNDGHRMFHVKCCKCGWETNKQMHQIKYVKECKHKNRFGEYIVQGKVWDNKRLCGIFKGMLDRCYNPTDKNYRWYGAKGIKICEEWLNNPKLFETWSINNGYKKGLTIDRINENKNYSPDNCRWITGKENAKYKSTTRIIEIDGIKHTGREWPIFLNLGTNTINKMLREYPEEQVKEFIRRRLQDLTKTRRSHQTWMNVYGLE